MIIHLTGADTYRSAQRLNELRQAFIAKHDPRGFNTVAVDAETASPEELHTAVTASGFFSTKRFVALDRYVPSSAISPEQLLKICQPISAKENDTILVIRDIVDAVKPSRSTPKKKKTATVKKKRMDIPELPNEKLEMFPLMNEGQAAAWVIQQATNIHGSFVPAAAQRLVAVCNRDTWRMAAEIEKLVAHAGGEVVTVADVESLVKSEASSDIFSLTDALGQQQHARFLELLHRELASGTNEFALIATLAGHIRNLYQVKLAQERGVSSAAMANELALHPFVVQKALGQSARFTALELRDLHHRLLTIDQDLKTSPLDAETLLDLISIRR